jgi:hypothetical protein
MVLVGGRGGSLLLPMGLDPGPGAGVYPRVKVTTGTRHPLTGTCHTRKAVPGAVPGPWLAKVKGTP